MLNLRSLFTGAAALLAAVFAASCQQNAYYRGPEVKPRAVVKDGVAITLKDQKLTLIRNGKKVKDYDVSTSKFGIGSRNGSNCTPVGIHAVTSKIGEGQPSGMVFKSCRPTGEVVPVNARGRDPIVTRIIQLAGVESRNRNSHSRRIYIQTPYFLPTDSLLKALITAALARVDVRVMLPARSDSFLLDFASASYISQCLGAGVKFYFYRAGMLHTKCIIIDDELTTVGSTNFDFRSFEHNFEANLFIYSKQFNEQMLSVFRADLADSERVVAARWRKRSIVRRAIESVVRLLAPIL